MFRTALRRLLDMERPVPARSDAEVAAEVERNYPWNFAVNLLDGASFWFGASFISSSTILPLFISKLTDHPFAIGLLAVIAQGAWFLPQLFTANLVERLPRRKAVVVNLGLFLERLPILVLVTAPLIAARSPALALVVLFLSYAWHGLGAGIVATSWQDLVARCFPVDRRGRFFGLTSFIGAGTGALGAGLSTYLLSSHPFPTNFFYVFLIAALGISVSWLALALTREPVPPVAVVKVDQRRYLASLPDLLRRDRNFRRFLIARALMALGGMGMGFVTVAAVGRWHMPDSDAGLFTAALLAGQTIGNLAFGFVSDRFGHKLSLELGILSGATGFAIAWLAPAPGWYYAAFIVLGIFSSTIANSGLLVLMEFSEPHRRPTYMGIANTTVGIAGTVAPLIGAALAHTGYGSVFAVSMTVLIISLILMRWWVRDPRWVDRREPTGV